jgi:hypothetical protein
MALFETVVQYMYMTDTGLFHHDLNNSAMLVHLMLK